MRCQKILRQAVCRRELYVGDVGARNLLCKLFVMEKKRILHALASRNWLNMYAIRQKPSWRAASVYLTTANVSCIGSSAG